MSEEFRAYIQPNGPRPEYYAIAEHLWGKGIDIDSDGNSKTPDSKEWTELTLINRSDDSQRIDIDPAQESPLVLEIRGPEKLVRLAAGLLAVHCNCEVQTSLDGHGT
mgnify:CR=1 FL=1